MSDFTYKYPMPSITGDFIVYDRKGDRILLVKRKHDPYKDCWAIVGGFFNPIDNGNEKMDLSVKTAAIRELKEEVNIDLENIHPNKFVVQFVTIQDLPFRDPRGRVVTMVYAVTFKDGVDDINIVAQDDAAEVRWFSVREIMDGRVPMAFDHQNSVMRFIHGVRYA